MNNNDNNPEFYMTIALEEAKKAHDEGEIPVGVAIVFKDGVIATAHNTTRQCSDPTAHAELIAIKQATMVLKNERLNGCRMYVTKEPCAMCAGAIVHARIEKLYIGVKDKRFGACGTVLNVCGNDVLNHKPQIIFGILEEECKNLLKSFFEQLRKKG